MRIAIYSGSFNPIHSGHQQLAGFLLQQNIADEVWFVVSPCNPLKKQSDLIDEHIRLEMVKLAIGEDVHLKVSDVEFTMPIPSYSIDTLTNLSTQFPQHQFILIIGSDNAVIFNQWKNYREILDKFEVYVYPRRNFDVSKAIFNYPEMKVMDTPYYDISSTEIREMIRKGEEVNDWLHPSVQKFISDNNLYI
jgi:nicotinate-nucleotide adenylyltransferase